MEPMVVMAARAAQRVGQDILKAHMNRHRIELDIESKGVDGLVTKIDKHSEELLIALLQKSYPDHSFLGEEFGLQEGKGNDADWCWVIDPLDGTQNFVHGFPHFCVSVAVQHKGVTQHGVIYDPIKDELFSATRGKGAMLNQRRIKPTSRSSLEGAFLTTGHPIERVKNGQRVSYASEHFKTLEACVQAGAQVRRLGSAALDLAYVAAGRFDGFFEMDLKPWDIAAGELIVHEAKGVVVDHKGAPNAMNTGSTIACGPKLLKPLMTTVVPLWGDAVS